jgi:hypothetical protein
MSEYSGTLHEGGQDELRVQRSKSDRRTFSSITGRTREQVDPNEGLAC